MWTQNMFLHYNLNVYLLVYFFYYSNLLFL
jgi:hypothetical protein